MKVPFIVLALCAGWIVPAKGNDEARRTHETLETRASAELAGFLKTVVERNPRVLAARDGYEASGALRDAASRPLYNPEISLEAENSDTNLRALGLSQTLDWGGKRDAIANVAESNRLIARAEYLVTRWTVTLQLLEGLAQNQTAREVDVLAEQRHQVMDEFATLAQRRFEAGDLAQIDLELARLALTDARINKATNRADLAEARQSVRSLAPDLPSTQWPELPSRLPDLSAESNNPESSVSALPEVILARRQVGAADAVVTLRQRQRRPDPTVSLTGGKEGDETLVGLSFSMPLFVRNNYSDEVSAAAAQRSQSRQLASDVEQRARARLDSAIERYQLTLGAWQDWQTTGKASLGRQARQLKTLWQAGEISTTDYLLQIRQTLDVQESALKLRHALWRAWFEWLWASGQIDNWLGQ